MSWVIEFEQYSNQADVNRLLILKRLIESAQAALKRFLLVAGLMADSKFNNTYKGMDS